MAYEITGPVSYGPQYIPRPRQADSPAGPRSAAWPSAHLGRLGFVDPYYNGSGYENGYNGNGYTVPPVTTYAPYCENVWLWVIGTAVVMLVLTQRGK